MLLEELHMLLQLKLLYIAGSYLSTLAQALGLELTKACCAVCMLLNVYLPGSGPANWLQHATLYMCSVSCQTPANSPLCMLLQLNFLYLWGNKLEGNVPETWSTLNNVSHCRLALAG